MSRGDGGGLLARRFLKSPLSQVIELAGQAPGGLKEELTSGRFEGIGADAHFLEAEKEISLGILRSEG
jgi:hypothetical protein